VISQQPAIRRPFDNRVPARDMYILDTHIGITVAADRQ
jgi:hypothetical protein